MENTQLRNLDNLPGQYIGNVEGVLLGLGSIMKTASVNITCENKYLKITSKSWRNDEVTNSFYVPDIAKFFGGEKEDVVFEDGSTGNIVTLVQPISGFLSGFFGLGDYLSKRWYGDTQTYWEYKLEFVDAKLRRFRLRKYNTSDINTNLYDFEISGIVRS